MASANPETLYFAITTKFCHHHEILSFPRNFVIPAKAGIQLNG